MKLWNDQNCVSSYNEDALKEQHMDSLFRLAFLQIEQEQADSLQALVDANKAGMPIAEMDELYTKSRSKIVQMIDKGTIKSQRQRFLHRRLPQITRIAAAILLTLFMGFSVAFATVRSVRVQVLKFLIKVEEQYTELSLVKDEGAAIDVPIDWKGNWYPSYIPEGFTLTSVGMDGYKLFYSGPNDRMITFAEYSVDFEVNMDTENSELSYIPLNGADGLMATKGDSSLITWALYDRFYLLRVDASPEEATKIAEQMKRVR